MFVTSAVKLEISNVSSTIRLQRHLTKKAAALKAGAESVLDARHVKQGVVMETKRKVCFSSTKPNVKNCKAFGH